MKKLDIEKVTAGLRLNKNVYTAEWRILLPKGAVLTDGYIQKLKELNYSYIFVEDDLVDDIEIEEVLSEELLIKIYGELSEIFNAVKTNRPFNLGNLAKMVDDIIYSMVNHTSAVQLVDYGPNHNFLIAHSVNTSILSILTGLAMGLTPAELSSLAMGAILHDIGINYLDEAVLSKPIANDSPHMKLLKEHVDKGFNLLRGRSDISLVASHISYQHHENYDGTGYPRNLKGEDIHLFARIVAIAESYDALITDRVYRKRVMPHEAMETIIALSDSKFDPNIAKVFSRNVPVYPLGTEVILSDGKSGVVVALDKNFPTRPTLRIVKDEDGMVINKAADFSLLDNTSVFVTKILS
jgi:HD-GYP domain-containing protein (c-di-GMP phosphodiesterase class II)